MSTAFSQLLRISNPRNGNRFSIVPHQREATREELDRREIEEAVIAVKTNDSSNPLDRAWNRGRIHRCSRDDGLPQGLVVSAVREWLAKRGLDGVFDSKELEEWAGEWRNGGGRRNPSIADLRTEFGGDDGVL